MALSGSFTGSTSNQYVQPKITWSATQNIAENYSMVTATLTYSRTNSGYTTAGKWVGSITINGTTVAGSSGDNQIYITQNSNTFAMSATVKVPHNADGSKSVAISCTGDIPASGSMHTTNCASTVELNSIPRQATITAANNFTDLDNPSFSFSNPGGFAMDVWLEPNPVGDHLCIRKNIPNTGSYTWTLTNAEREQLRNKCAGKSCTIRIGLYSYIGGTTYTSYVDKTFTMTENTATRPSVTMSLSPDNSSLPSAFAGLYVQGKSKAKVTLTAAGKYGASISSYSTSIGGKAYTAAAFTTDTITKSGSIAIAGSAKDSRGFTGTANGKITVIPYTTPWITSFLVERQADGTTVVARLKGGVSPVDNKNSKTFSVTLNGTTKTISSTSYDVDGTVTFTDIPTDATLIAEAKIADAISAPVTKEATVPTIAVTMDFHSSGTGVAFGKVAEHENLLDVAWDIKYKGSVIADFVIEEGADDDWAYRKWHSGKAEAWLTKELSFAATPSALLGGYYAATSIGMPGGVFERPPACIAMGRIGTGIGFASVGSTTNTSISISVFGNQNGTTSYITALYATGQWK